MLPRADDCTSLTCKGNRVALLKETKQIFEYVDGLEAQLFEHIATTEEHRDLIKALRGSYDRLHRPPLVKDIADMAEAMRREILLDVENPNIDRGEVEVALGSSDGSPGSIQDLDMDVQVAEMGSGSDDYSSSAASGSDVGTDLSSAGLSVGLHD
jgi:hypothetical protein